MCGIAGVYAYDDRAARVNRVQIERTCTRMDCRGPDGEGLWISGDERVGLGHRRLAIIDLSDRGAQPMHSDDGRFCVVFNGEIYNYRELRKQLISAGHQFKSDSDTEVLIELYRARGARMVHQLRGMFAFAIWDEQRKGMFLARDSFGIKPLYYADDGRTLRFASEVKALLAGGGIDTSPDPAGHVGLFLWGNVPEPYTMYKGIHALPAGHTMWVERQTAETPQEYASLNALIASTPDRSQSMSAAAVREELRAAMIDSVRHHLLADVKVGVFLSAGLDSTTLAALVSETGADLQTVTLGFSEFRGTSQDEVPLAESVAKQYGATHSTVWVTRADFETELERLIDRMDQPTMDGVNTYFVSRAAAEAGLKVALSGVGGDELFGGYPSFRQIPKLVSTLSPIPGAQMAGSILRRIASPFVRSTASPKYIGLLEYGTEYADAYLLRRCVYTPWELTKVLDPDLLREGWNSLRAIETLGATTAGIANGWSKVSALEAKHYMRNQLLRDTDWASMSFSLEVRVPFVDWTLWKVVSGLAGAMRMRGKNLLASTPSVALPAEILERAKSGFAIPTREWLASGQSERYRGLRGWIAVLYARHCGSAE